jgi:hypothetical protein
VIHLSGQHDVHQNQIEMEFPSLLHRLLPGVGGGNHIVAQVGQLPGKVSGNNPLILDNHDLGLIHFATPFRPLQKI